MRTHRMALCGFCRTELKWIADPHFRWVHTEILIKDAWTHDPVPTPLEEDAKYDWAMGKPFAASQIEES